MKNIKSHFEFNKQERSGIFFLLLIIVVLYGCYYTLTANTPFKDSSFVLDKETQATIDSLKMVNSTKDSVKMYPFNPNFITDYKGYVLGMSPKEIDRLHNFRNTNGFVSSKEEFQQVTLVSDSLLNVIAPYFKFPEWVAKENKSKKFKVKSTKEIRENKIFDLNTATAQQLKTINGVGEVLSKRIVKFRDRLGGFLVNEQLYDVYGMESEVVERTLHQFQVLHQPKVDKININTASVEEIASLVYLKYDVAKNIVSYRETYGKFKAFDDLFNVEGFPVNKIDRIALYLLY